MKATAASAGVLTAVVMTAFAANSLLARAALGGARIDPYSFTAIRLLAGAAILLPWWWPSRVGKAAEGSPLTAFALFAYALAFSIAYVSLDAGTGALLLFAAVQVTMVVVGLRQGHRPSPAGVLGILVAMAGLVVLVFPGLSAPSPTGAAWMTLSGVAWGLYSMWGRGARLPLMATAGSFGRSIPLALAAGLVAALVATRLPSLAGIGLAATSGAVTSALGYVLWYRALAYHSPTSAAVVQLSVPLIAGLGGVVFLGESASLRLVAGGLLILGGIALSLVRPRS